MRLALRLVAIASLVAAATPALAQSMAERAQAQLRESQLRAQQDMANRRMVIIQNELSTLDAQVRSDRAMSDVRAQSYTPTIPAPHAGGPPPQIDTGGLASIPDAALADSNARVKAAADNRR